MKNLGPLKYFVFNKQRDYRSGFFEHTRTTEDGIELNSEHRERHGIFFSRILDSGNGANHWHRAVIESEDYGDDSICFYFYCSDSDHVTADGAVWKWTELIQSRKFTAEQKHEIMQPYLAHRIFNPKDVLLYRAGGRYLWIEIHLFRQAEFTPKIRRMKIYSEAKSFLRYLPEIYQKEESSDFLRRYLSLFEAVYEDLDQKIRSAARQLDPASADADFLQWMAGWVGITHSHLWSEEKLRLLLQGIVKKNLIRGTREYMEYVIRVFTGETPWIVEYSEIERYRGNRKVYDIMKKYYSHGPYEVNILVREEAVPTLREQKALKNLLEDIRPAQIEVHLIILRPYIYLDQNVYVGINSSLGTYQKTCLNGMTAIPSLVVAANRGGEGEEYEKPEMFSI